MSGHSKWSKVKHQKATTDVARGQAFTKAARAITVAVTEGGGVADPAANFRLRLAVEKAREVNMPRDTIKRAIAKGKGDGEGQALESILYEGYGPHGVAFLIEAATDNRQRTASSIKHIFDRSGGSLAGPGAVSFLFTAGGLLVIQKTPSLSFDTLFAKALEAGADDVVGKDDVFEVYTHSPKLMEVKERLTQGGLAVSHAELVMRPTTFIDLPSDAYQTIIDLEARIGELPDVQRVHTNARAL